MDQDSPSPITRVERTLWSVWYYITGAVNRLLRPEPTGTVSNEPNSIQESAVDSEPANCGFTEGDTCRGEVDEKQSLSAASPLGLSRPLVAWEHGTTEINLRPDEENMRDITLLTRGTESEASEEGECTRKGQFTQTGNDNACLLIAKDAGTREDEQEENDNWKLDTPGRDGYERHANTVPLNVTDDATSEDVEENGIKAGAEDETDVAMIRRDQQKMDETVTNIQIQEEDSEMQGEADFEYSHAVRSMEAEETELNLGPEEEDNTHVEAETVVTPEEVENSDDMLQLASETENKLKAERQAENLPSVSEELPDVDRDSEGDTSIVSSDAALMVHDKSGIMSEDDQIDDQVVGQEQMRRDRDEEMAYDNAEDQKEEEDDNAVYEEEHGAVIQEENVNELAETSNNQTTDEVPEQENDIETVTEDNQEEDIITACVGCSEDFTHIATTELQKAEFTDREQEHVTEDTEVQTKTTETDDIETKSHKTVVTPEEVENSDDVLQLASERKNNRQAENLPSVCEELSDVDRDFEGDTSTVSSDDVLMAHDKSGIMSEDDQIVVGQEQMMLDRDEEMAYDNAEDQKEEEDDNAVYEEEHGAVIEEENVNELAETLNNQTIDELLERENDIETVTEDNQEEDIITACVGCSEDFTQIATTEPHRAEFTDREQEHVTEDTEVQTKTTETDDIETKNHEMVVTLSLSRPLVAWEHGTTEINLRPDEENMRDITLLTRVTESEASEEGECTRKGQFTQTGNDDACLLIAKDAGTREDEQEENDNWKLDTPGRDGYERHANTVPLNVTDDATSEDVEENGIKAGAEDETDVAMIRRDQQKMDETVTNIQIQEEDSEMQGEADFEYSHAVRSMEAEETELNLGPEEEDNTHVEAETVVTPEEVENSDGMLQLASEMENKLKAERQAENLPSVSEELPDVDRDSEGDTSIVSSDAALMVHDKSGIMSEDDQIDDQVVGQEQMRLDRDEEMAYDNAEDQKEEEDDNTVYEEEHGAVIEEETVNELAETSNNQTTDELLEQENDIETVTEDNQEEDIITACVGCSEDFTQIATTELQRAEFTDREQEQVQTKTRETDDIETKSHETVIIGKSDVGGNKTEAEQERRSSASDNNGGRMEIACACVTVKPDGEVVQEISGEFKNIPPGISEGWAVVSQELNSITCEETQEGVPEYNNEPGPYENTTQRILEGGDDEEIQTTQLPEEVESEEPESLQNSGSSSGADYLLLKERMEEEQDSRLTTTEESKNIFDEDVGILSVTDAQGSEEPLAEPVIQESGHLFVQEETQLLDSTMKMGISEQEFETHVGSANDTKELQDVTEELLVEFEVDEGLCDTREADAVGGGHETTAAFEDVADETLKLLDAEEQKISFYDESVNTINSTSETFSFLGDVTESGFLQQSVEAEPKLLEDCSAEMQDATIQMQDAEIDMEETSYGFEAEVAEDETQNKNETEILNLQVMEMATELTADTDEKETALIAGLESSINIKTELQFMTLETEVQLSDEALGETDTETAEDSTGTELKHLTTEETTEEMEKHESGGSYAEETGSSISGRLDVIDEEILDLWIETALSEETVGTKQQEQQMDTEREPSNEEQDEMQSEKEEEQLGESNSLESGLVSDTEISLSTVESEILDQSLGEWGTQSGESQLLKSSNTESFQGIDDTLACMSESADVSEVSIKQPPSELHDLLIEVTAEAGQSYLKEEESITVADQESDKLEEETEEERIESVETGAASQREIDAEVGDPEDEDDEVEQTNVQDEPLETNASDSLNEISSGQSRSDSEASLEEGIVSTDSDLQGETCVESEEKLVKLPSLDKPQAPWSEDIAESSSGPIGAEVEEEPRTKPEDQIEVDTPVLDFTPQKSRIAVKNRHVRPPKDPRSLLHMPSVEPTPSKRLPVKVPAGVPLGGLGIGIKLPGLGAGFPVLKKTQRVVRDENNPETSSQETKPEEKDDTPKQDEAQQKPKWMPPRHPGFGNPLMSELKTKLKKTTKE